MCGDGEACTLEVEWRGVEMGMGGPTSTFGGQKVGGMSQKQGIPTLVQTTQPSVLVPGK